MADGYTYNAIAEHPIIPEFDETTKWKWNGALLDLSELPFDEYTKTIFQTSGSGGGGDTGSTGSTIVTNAITVSLDNTGSTYDIVATLQYPSDTNVTVTVTVAGQSSPVSVTIPAGSLVGRTATEVGSSDPRPAVSDPSVSPIKDENYTYQVILPDAVVSKFKAYYGVLPETSLDALTAEEINTMDTETIDADGSVLKFYIPSREFLEIDDDEIEALKNGLVLAIPNSVYTDNKYELLEHAFQSETDFTKRKEVVIGTTAYAVLTLVGDDVQFVPRYMQEVEYDFDLKFVE